jgi:hypothetical protein
MPDISSAVIVIVFMVALSLIINFIGNTFLELVIAILDRISTRKKPLNSIESLQYDNTGENNDVDTTKVTI